MRLSFLVVTALLMQSALAVDPSPHGNVIDIETGGWEFVGEHSDEFDAEKIDDQKWKTDTEDFGPWSWEPSNVIQKGGSMHLRMVQKDHQRDGKALHYTSGLARNPKTITYGFFEARVKGCSRYPGACPSFWLYSIGPQNRFQASDGETVAYSEIDVVELQQSEFDFVTKKHFPVTRIDCNLHTTLIQDGKRVWARPGNRPEICANHFDSPWDPREDYHVYAVESSQEEIVWYIDGTEVARKPNLYWHLPMHITLSLGLRYPFVGFDDGERFAVKDQTTDDGFPTHMSVDYVRVWQKPPLTTSPNDWSMSDYVTKEKANWEKNNWPWNIDKVESNFAEIDTNQDGIASGLERKNWYDTKAAKD
ncbi:MAG: kappa-carrageenase [Pirellulaceae bacterium]